MSQTVAALVRKLQQYPQDATVRLPAAFRVEQADGEAVAPLFRWYEGGFDTPAVGDRVRKFGYFDTGTVDEVDRGWAHVVWDQSGASWERYVDLGRAVE